MLCVGVKLGVVVCALMLGLSIWLLPGVPTCATDGLCPAELLPAYCGEKLS